MFQISSGNRAVGLRRNFGLYPTLLSIKVSLLALVLVCLIGPPYFQMNQTEASADAEGRNVLIIIADDLGVETLASYDIGPSLATTPNLDRLAQNGVQFQNAWAYPICTPFRAAALTGRFGFRTGVGTVGPSEAGSLPSSEKILPEILDDHPELGVAHAAIGKWHLGGGRTGATDHGFGTFVGALGVVEDYFAWQRVEDGQVAIENNYATSVQVDDALAWINGRASDPWFMWLAFNAPHDPFHRPPEDLFTIDLPPGDPPANGGGAEPYFHAAIEAMDHEIGRLLSSMDPEVLDRTTIIFVGDNGSPVRTIGSPFGRDTSKGSLYQGGIWAPLIVSGAGVSDPGRTVDHLVHSVDLLATSLELLGLPSEEWPDNIDSRSVVPLLTGLDAGPIRDWAFSEQFGGRAGAAKEGKTIRDLRYKYIRFDDGKEALFDLDVDPYESRELIAAGLSAAESAALESLQQRLENLLSNPPAVAPPVNTEIAPTGTSTSSNTNTPSGTSTSTPSATVTTTSESTPDESRLIYLPFTDYGD